MRAKDVMTRLALLIAALALALLPMGCGSAANSGSTSGGSSQQSSAATASQGDAYAYVFRNNKYLQEHYSKHGKSMGFASAEDYEMAASEIATNPNALHKTEKEDGDDVYYLEETNDFVIVSTDGYIRTYFRPDSGISYFNRQ